MLVKRTVSSVPPHPTVPLDPGNRPTSPESNIRGAIERQFAQARRAWVRFQSARQRDAVYGYLSVVLAIVQRWNMLGHTRTCSLHALTAGKEQASIRSRDPFAIVIYCTSDPRIIDARTRSKWARALRFAARFKPAGQPLGRFMKSHGGINTCSMSS